MKKILVLTMAAVLVFCFTSLSFAVNGEIKLTSEEKRLISKLQPTVTEEELAVYRENKGTGENSTIENFVATRQYFRDLRAKFPGNFDPKMAPPTSKSVVFKFCLTDKEASNLYDIRLQEAKKKAGF
jgi:hypothetical protein